MFLSVLFSLGVVLPVCALTVTLPDAVLNGSITAESTSVAGMLDGPKLSPGVNDTSYDWWYFDAVSASTNESVMVVLYNSGSNGFINGLTGGPLSANIAGSFANGSTFSYLSAATSSAIITIDNGSISGDWKGSGFTFRGIGLETPHPIYTIIIDAPEIGVYGAITLRSISPSHYPCGPNVSGEKEEMLPYVFWANAVPDAITTVDLDLNGAHLQFSDGIGYHDKNWGDRSFATVTKSWYWGHARVGPYSVVWFDALDSAGIEHVSGYVTKHGRVLESSCAKNAVTVRPWGANSEYPPTPTTGIMQGLSVVFNLDGMDLVANVTTGQIGLVMPTYVRALGTVKARVEGISGYDEVFEGRAFFEEFKF